MTSDCIGYTDCFHVYDVLDASEFHHKRVNHSKTLVSTRHLRGRNGIPKNGFYWFLKEWRGASNGSGHRALFNQFKSWYLSEINKP